MTGEEMKMFGVAGMKWLDSCSGKKTEIPAIPDAGTVESYAGQPVVYDGLLAGLSCYGALRDLMPWEEPKIDIMWSFEGKGYDTPATEAEVMATVEEALTEPDRAATEAAREFVFGGKTGFTYTSQALLAMLVAYEQEGCEDAATTAVASILREAARRIAVVEALTV